MVKKHPLIFMLFILIFAALACNFPQRRATGPAATFTALAQTLDLFLTQTAVAGGQATATPTPTATLIPTATLTQRPANTSVPPPAILCDSATFIADVTIPDDTVMNPNQSFRKTWRIRNTGSCTWNTSYALIFDSGTAMNAPSTIAMPGTVAPGQAIDLSIDLVAPAAAGTYRGNFKLRNSSGASFGIGPNANVAFWVQVKVGTPTITPTATPTVTTVPGSTLVYDFAANYCSANWSSGAGALICEGNDNDVQGFVIRLNNPTLETGTAAGAVSLETHPQWVDNGYILGRYPAITVNSGYRFKTRLACLTGGAACSVRFSLRYSSDGGAVTSLGEWDQVYDSSVQDLDLDVSSLAGHSVEFILNVSANGPAAQDWAVWVAPRITR